MPEIEDEKLKKVKDRIQFYHRRALTLRNQGKSVREYDYLDGQLELAQQLLAETLQIERGDKPMEIGGSEIVVKVVKLSEIRMRGKRSETDQMLVEKCKELDRILADEEAAARKEGRKPEELGLEIVRSNISYNNINQRLGVLAKEWKLIDESFKVKKVGDTILLIKKPAAGVSKDSVAP